MRLSAILASSSFEMKKLAVLITVHLCGNKYYKMLIHFFMSCFVKAYPEDSITDHVFMSKLASTYLSMNKLAVVFMVLLCANNAKNRLLIYSCLASTCVHCLSFVTTINLSFFLSHIYFLKHILIVNKMYYCWFIISKGFFANKYDGNTGCSLNIVFFP